MTRSLAVEHNYRCAIGDHPNTAPPCRPTVSVIVPVYNEIDCLDRLVTDLLAQDYERIVEFWFADGCSQDGTYETLLRLRDVDDRIRVIRNPKRGPAAGINLALELATGDIVNRLDAHARYEPDVVTNSVKALLATGAAGVGAIARPSAGRTLIGHAIVAAHKSPFGVGVAKFRRHGAEGWTDAIWNGCYWKHIVDRVGPLREDLHRAEDNDFNARIQGLGYGLYLSPAIRAWYLPRQTLRSLWRQYFANGVGVVRAARERPDALSWRHFAPLALVLAVGCAGLITIAWPGGLLSLIFLLAYLGVLALATLLAAWQERGAYLLLLPIALATLHFSYGFGSLWALVEPPLIALVRRARPA
ncbi:glycosyltransferase family 2 protein [Bosea sp. UC22_33]|uniref:glycosyltransferase family 2 protein n=1 Tax=Bosea sp. UC22_33 TaxID=3350165 RepID=UPI00366E03FB